MSKAMPHSKVEFFGLLSILVLVGLISTFSLLKLNRYLKIPMMPTKTARQRMTNPIPM